MFNYFSAYLTAELKTKVMVQQYCVYIRFLKAMIVGFNCKISLKIVEYAQIISVQFLQQSDIINAYKIN